MAESLGGATGGKLQAATLTHPDPKLVGSQRPKINYFSKSFVFLNDINGKDVSSHQTL